MYPDNNQPDGQPGQPQPPQVPQEPQPVAQPQYQQQPAQPQPVVGAAPQQIQPQTFQPNGTPVPDMQTPQVQPQAQYAPQQTMYSMQPQPSKKKFLIAILAVVVVIALGVAAYFLLSGNGDTSKKTNKAASESSGKSKAVALGTLKGVSFVAPTMEGYTLSSSSTDTLKVYKKDDCSLQFGTADATNLPGTDLGDIVDRQIKSLRDSGVTVNGPEAGQALVLKNSTDSSKEYSLPTLIFKASKDNDYVLSHYSAVVLPGGQRAFITRVCTTKDSPVNASALDGVEAQAVKVTVTPQP